MSSIYKVYASLIQQRLAEALDADLQRTQYGFRKSRSTVIPLACIRRILERAEASRDPCFVVFLDWEKAFDRIKQEKLVEVLERMNVPNLYVEAIRSLYQNPSFAVRVGEECSAWKTQRRGIRQGCPLSPYLFIILMTVMFRDIHDDVNLNRGKVEPIDYTELLYADDTALITNNVNAMGRLLTKIEEHPGYYGLNFNKGKCVCLNFNAQGSPKFKDGSRVKQVSDASYLGSNISCTHNLQAEINRKISSCFVILNKLNFFWSKSNCPTKFKLDVFDAVIRSKLVYGLEVVHLTKSLMQRLNTFQLKGLRKILKMKTTFVERCNTNAKVFEEANRFKTNEKRIKPFSVYIEEKQEALLKHLVRAESSDPLRMSTLRFNSPLPCGVINRRVGRPRETWAHNVYSRMWSKYQYGSSFEFKTDPNTSIQKMEAAIQNRTI